MHGASRRSRGGVVAGLFLIVGAAPLLLLGGAPWWASMIAVVGGLALIWEATTAT